MADPLFSLTDSVDPHRWQLRLVESLCVGPATLRAMFGGVGLAAGVQAMELSCGRQVVWAAAQFISRAPAGSVLDINVSFPASGRNTAQARAIGRVGESEIFTVSGALGGRDGASDQQWVEAPKVARPADCAPAAHRVGSEGGLHDQFDVRTVQGHYGFGNEGAPPSPDARLILWARPKGNRAIDSTALAVLSDYVPAGIGNAFGVNLAGFSLDNTVRIHRRVATEWVLCDITIHSVHNGFSHGAIRLFAENGQLIATGSQSAIVRSHERTVTSSLPG